MLNSCRKVLSNLGVVAGLVILSGCGSGPLPEKSARKLSRESLTIAVIYAPQTEILMKMAREWGAAKNVEIKQVDNVPDELAGQSSNLPGDLAFASSRWLAQGAERCVELTEWLQAEVNLGEIEPAALKAISEHPAGSNRYYAAPCQMDACGFAYRKDLFEDGKEKEAFKARYNKELETPKTWQDMKAIAEFFKRPEQKLYGIALFTGKETNAVTAGFQQVLFAWGASYGELNSADGIAALEFYKDLCQHTPPGASDYGAEETMKAFADGSAAMAMTWFSAMPALLDPSKNPHAGKTGFFAMPAGSKGRFATPAGFGLAILKHAAPKQQALARDFIKWFHQTNRQIQWAGHGGCFSANLKALESGSAPYSAAFRESLPLLRGFNSGSRTTALLSAAQQHWNAALKGKQMPKDAMDSAAAAHARIHKEAGLPK